MLRHASQEAMFADLTYATKGVWAGMASVGCISGTGLEVSQTKENQPQSERMGFPCSIAGMTQGGRRCIRHLLSVAQRACILFIILTSR